MAVVIEHRDVQKLLNDDQLWKVLKEHKQIVGLIAGYLHRAIYATWHGLLCLFGSALLIVMQ